MDALILAAGLGTRLGPIGRETPKALLEVGGRTMLERVAERLVAAGVDRIVVNVHHHAQRIAAFVAEHDLGAEVCLSVEAERPLETGGGLRHAAPLLRRDAPILVHNVDVWTDASLHEAVAAHRQSGALATLLVNDRPTARHLLFDGTGLLGRSDARDGFERRVRAPEGAVRPRAFAGIHVLDPTLLDRITERGAFPILDLYLRLAEAGARIESWSLGDATWLEVGTPERLAAVRAFFEGREGEARPGSAPA